MIASLISINFKESWIRLLITILLGVYFTTTFNLKNIKDPHLQLQTQFIGQHFLLLLFNPTVHSKTRRFMQTAPKLIRSSLLRWRGRRKSLPLPSLLVPRSIESSPTGFYEISTNDAPPAADFSSPRRSLRAREALRCGRSVKSEN